LIVNTFRTFGSINDLDTTLLKYLAVSFSAVNGFLRPGWGILFDKFGFKKLFLVINLGEAVISSVIYFTVGNAVIFSIFIILSGFLMAGVFALLPAFVSKTFGLK
jgi:OFA family oxalate/formate antiporter-like MFS transporter